MYTSTPTQLSNKSKPPSLSPSLRSLPPLNIYVHHCIYTLLHFQFSLAQGLSILLLLNFLMAALSPAINPALVPPPITSRSDHALPSSVSYARRTSRRSRIPKRIQVKAEAAKQPSIDFSDPDWKSKFQSDFEARFRIPHITDVIPDAVSYPSTFCLKMRFAAPTLTGIFF